MNFYKKAKGIIQSMFGDPIGEGRHRIVYRVDENAVIKVPTQESGVGANYCELNLQGDIYAKTHVDEYLSELAGVLIIRMEFVKHVGSSEKPDWTWSIDCGQVGLTNDGRLVAYDWDHC